MEEDIRTVDISPIVTLVKEKREAEPDCKIAIWASLECTNFSRAKCGPKDADSRTLAEDMFRYLDAIDPDFFWVENVEEFRSWGPLDEEGNPDKSKLGESYRNWCDKLVNDYFDFHYFDEVLMSSDYGGRTIRKRLFLQFAKDSNNIGTPKQTHSKDGSVGAEWLPVRDVLDLSNHGNSIFTRKRRLVEKTHKNIYKGLTKYTPDKGTKFGYTYYGNSGLLHVDNPCPTLTTKDRVALVNVSPICTMQQFGNAVMRSIDEPFGTLTTVPKGDLISAKSVSFVVNPQYGGSTRSIDQPAATVIARQDKAPLSLASAPRHDFDSIIRRVPGAGNEHIEFDAKNNQLIYTIYEDDDQWFQLIKEYMFENNLIDVCTRTLTVVEMLQIQGFPADYVLEGTQTEAKKYIGNSVEVNVGIALFKAIDESIQHNN
jgi:DNA (cytosine-5)-methyltransferase 1